MAMATQAAKKRTTKGARPKTVEDYLAAAPTDQRTALMRLRRTIKAAAPNATERIAYGMVGYKQSGKPLAHFAYWKAHCSLYGSMSTSFIRAHAAELKPYLLSKGTIQFPADKPLPDRLVTQIVKARVAEIEAAG
jgi:uncharacterized protein YdhG (YjbR/CyaY superfamily)